MDNNLSANQRWKQSGTTLSFKDYMNREKTKMASFSGNTENSVIINKPLNDAVRDSLESAKKDAGFKTTSSGKTVLGINKNILIISSIVIIAAIGYKIYKNKKS